MKMMTKTVLMTVGVALAATVAQANVTPIVSGTLYNSMEMGVVGTAHGGGTPATFTIQSEYIAPLSTGVASADEGGGAIVNGTTDYLYLYFQPVGQPAIDSFTVQFSDIAGAVVAGSAQSINPAWSGNPVAFGVTWQTGTAGDVVGPEELYFLSPLPPTWGVATIQDNGQWNDDSQNPNGVVIPNTPDGGLTVALLGGALVGLGALRRKLGC